MNTPAVHDSRPNSANQRPYPLCCVGDAGSIVLEMVLVTPVVILLLAFVGLAGRVA